MTTITIERAVIHRALSALEYHTQQTRPIHNTELVIEELKSALSAPATAPAQPERSTHEQAQWTALENLPNKYKTTADNAMTDFELTRSVIYDCPALRLPQSFIDRLGMVAQIVVLKGASPEIAKFIASACNAHTEALAAMKEAQ